MKRKIRLNKKGFRVLKLALVVSLLVTTWFSSYNNSSHNLHAEGSQKLNATDLINKTLSTGDYKVYGSAEYEALAGENVLKIEKDATVTLDIQGGTINFKGGDAQGKDIPGAAAIHVPESSSLNIKGTGKIIAKGGNASNGADAGKGENGAEGNTNSSGGRGGIGGAGAGAGIGGNGAKGGNAGQNGYDVTDSCGSIMVFDSVVIEAQGGQGGSGGNGGSGGASFGIYTALTVTALAAGAGGGGGGGGYPAAGIGSGGAGAGGGGQGGNGYGDTYPAFVISAKIRHYGGGGGGGGAGYGSGAGGSAGRGSIYAPGTVIVTFNPDRLDSMSGGKAGDEGKDGDKDWIGMSGDYGRKGKHDLGGEGGSSETDGYGTDGGNAGKNIAGAADIYVSTKATVTTKHGGAVGKTSYNAVDMGSGAGVGSEVKTIKSRILDLSDCTVELDKTRYEYTGRSQKPNVTVMYHDEKLPPNSYTLEYDDDLINVGTKNIKIVGKADKSTGAYLLGKNSTSYRILQTSQNPYLTSSQPSIELGQDVTVSVNENKSNGNVEWKLTDSSVKATITTLSSGTVRLTPEATGTIEIYANVAGNESYNKATTKTLKISVTAQGISNFHVEGVVDKVYTGEELYQDNLVISYNGTVLKENIDYELHYDPNVEVGIVVIEIVGIGERTGTIYTSYQILPRDITEAQITAPSDLTYTGQTQTSEPIVTYQGKTLEKDKDYTVFYDEYVNAGTVTTLISGIGSYTGSTTTTYKIHPMKIDDQNTKIQAVGSYTYNGKANEASGIVTQGDHLLSLSNDYTLEYKDNVNAGTATIIAKGKGNYTGSVSTTFTIDKQVLDIIPNEDQFKYKGAEDPQLKFVYSGQVSGETPTFKSDTGLSRDAGEAVGVYGITIGNLELDPNNPINKNYEIKLTTYRNFEIKKYIVADEATLSGTMGKNDWYVSRVQIVAPAGYLISTNDAADGNWGASISYDDGDYTKNGAIYYLKHIDQGYISDYKTITYKQDTHGAESRIIVNDSKSWSGMYPTPSFSKTFFNEDAEIAVFGDDEHSGIDTVQYLLSSEIYDVDKLEKIPDDQWITISSDDKVITGDTDKHIVYVKMLDKAGNYNYGRSDGFIIDKVKPIIKYQYDLEGIWTSKDDVTISINVTDDVAGLKDRYVDYVINGETQLVHLDENGDGVISHLPDGDYILTINAVDNAGNTQKQDIHVKKDTVTPTISSSGDTETYATEQKVTLDIKTGSSGIDKVYVQHVAAGSEYDPAGNWQDITQNYQDIGGYIAEENGTYYFKIKSVVGLESQVTSIGFSRIDKAKPVVDYKMITTDTNSYLNNSWTNQSVKISFTNQTANLGTSIYEYSNDKGATWHTLELEDGYCSILLEDSQKHVIWLRITSNAKVESDLVILNINIDKVNPYGNIHIGDNNWRYLLKTLTCELFFKDTTDLIVAPQDDLSGLDKIEYFISSGDKSIYDNPPNTPNAVERLVSLNGGWKNGSQCAFTPNNQYNVGYAKITDNAGNVCYLSTDGFLMDNEKPIITSTEIGLLDFGSYGKWFTDPNSSVTFSMMDTLSGLDVHKVTCQIDNGTEESMTLENNSFTVSQLEDGIYNIHVKAYDIAGNENVMDYQVQKDTKQPEVKIVADTENYAVTVDSQIKVNVGASGINKVETQFVPEGQKQDESLWVDVTNQYTNNVQIKQKGTYYVRLTDNLNRQATTSAIFDKIEYMTPKAEVWLENSQGEKISTDQWLNNDGNVCVANDPANVKGFTYQYRQKGSSTWLNISADDHGIAKFKAEAGEHTYEVLVSNGTDKSLEEITVKADNSMPNGILTFGEIDPNSSQLTFTERYSIRQSLFQNNGIELFYPTVENKAIALGNVSDGIDESGVAKISYYVQRSSANEYLSDFPENGELIEKMVDEAGGWDTTINYDKWQKELNGQSMAQLSVNLLMNRSYVIYVKIVDNAGNARYIATDGFAFDNRIPNIETDYKTGTWLNSKSQGVRVSLSNSIGGMGQCSYVINGSETKVNNLQIVNESFIIPLDKFKNGKNTITIKAANKLGIAAEDKTIDVQVDKEKPNLSISGNTGSYALSENVSISTSTPISGIGKVEVKKDDGKWEDITSSFEDGYVVNDNGEYFFRVSSNAGNTSAIESILFDKIDGASPEPVIESYEVEAENVLDQYKPGTWTANDVELSIYNGEDNYGTSKVQYRLEENDQWEDLGELQSKADSQSLKLDETGEQKVQLKIVTQLGAESSVKEVPVLIDRENPEIEGKVLETSWKNDKVAISIEANDKLSGVQSYSFDGGQTFTSTNRAQVDKNQTLDIAVKDAVGNVNTASLEVSNVDKLLPIISQVKTNQSDWAKSKDVYANVVDSDATEEYGMSDIDYVFLTSHNPYSGKVVSRTEPQDDDILMRNTGGTSAYVTSKPITKYIDDIDEDNYYIVAVDEAGNAQVTSLCVSKVDGYKETVKPDDPDNPDKPDNSQNPDNSGNSDKSDSSNGSGDSQKPDNSGNNNGSNNSGGGDSFDGIIDEADDIIHNQGQSDSQDKESSDDKESIFDLLDKIEEMIKGGELTPEQIATLESKKTELIQEVVKTLIQENPKTLTDIQRNLDYINQLLGRDDLTEQQREELLQKYKELTQLYEESSKSQTTRNIYLIVLIILILSGSVVYTQYCKKKAKEEDSSL